MGKKNKPQKRQNSDPILKKNFKYEKRKKQREDQKKKIKEAKLDEQLKMKQLRIIQKKVQQDIEKLYQQQKRQLMGENKIKAIKKGNNMIDAFKNKQVAALGKMTSSMKNVQQQFFKDLTSYSIQSHQNSYEYHFESQLPEFITDNMSKQKKLTATMRMQNEIKQEIKQMFSVRKDDQQQQFEQQIKQKDLKSPIKKVKKQNQIDQQERKMEEMLQQQEKQQEPYGLDKRVKGQIEVLVEGSIYSISKVIVQTSKHCLSPKIAKKTQSTDRKYQKASDVLRNYIDYVHIENQEQQTIQDFRKVVISHMYEHQLKCLAALKQQKKSKGFTNAKYLIITPYVGDANAIFDIIEQYFMVDVQEQQQNQPINIETSVGKKNKKKQIEWVIQNKEKIQQNDDEQNDFFRVGLKVLPRKKKMVYFSNFDASDIIVASPIGLKSIINGDGGKKETSFLSSVQILYVDRASVIMMQNWDHLLDIFTNLNYMPKYESLKNSINEIRPEYLELKGRIYRQNIVFSEFGFPQLTSLKLNYFQNWQGCITSKHIFRPLALDKNNGIEKNFYKIELNQPRDDLQTRFQYFKRKFWDKIHNSDHMNKIVLFVNSYFQFVKLKGFLQKVNASFQSICEHTKKDKIQSRMARFTSGQFRILLLTERAYYFGLCQIKKQKHIYFYSLPKNAFIFKDMMENVDKDQDEDNKIVCIYSKYDKFIVERIVGTGKAVEMVREYCTNVSFIV